MSNSITISITAPDMPALRQLLAQACADIDRLSPWSPPPGADLSHLGGTDLITGSVDVGELDGAAPAPEPKPTRAPRATKPKAAAPATAPPSEADPLADSEANEVSPADKGLLDEDLAGDLAGDPFGLGEDTPPANANANEDLHAPPADMSAAECHAKALGFLRLAYASAAGANLVKELQKKRNVVRFSEVPLTEGPVLYRQASELLARVAEEDKAAAEVAAAEAANAAAAKRAPGRPRKAA